MALSALNNKVMGVAARMYRRILAGELNQTGLRYEDCINETEPVVVEALSLQDADVVTARNRRLKRAIDLSYKRKNLQDYAPDMVLEPFKEEIFPDIQKLLARDEEFAMMNLHNKGS
eukprot:CAMPEP_0195521878 /NCGR_PEP_ID=MMETSP0794_2-20130614/19578_1 /TAXON_ID=515487 /ORGANISM="Stephanopyxis turris, Strain CCMP 815" /LENGTH=116 /DNA_ID=CAMNT_0040651517 /DNA_START=48 /DNA_END=398 /DNA_ORIENTATION=-